MQTALLIFIVLFALAIGFFLGLFLLSLNTPLTKSLTKKDEPDSEAGSPEEGLGALPELKKPTPGSELILQVWKEAGQAPVYELEGKYVTKDELPRELLNLLTVQDQAPPPPAPPPPQETKESPPPAEDEAQEVEDEDAEEEIKMLSVVDEVNDILQKRLVGSPLAGKGIHLMENHNNEIRFWVGLNSYSDVEEIPEAEVRQIINESVKEWEKNRE